MVKETKKMVGGRWQGNDMGEDVTQDTESKKRLITRRKRRERGIVGLNQKM